MSAAEGMAGLRRNRREAVRLEEVDLATRAPILRRYLAVAPGAQPHLPVNRALELRARQEPLVWLDETCDQERRP